MKYQFIMDHKESFPIVKMSKVLEISTSGYYDWKKRKPSHREVEDQRLLLRLRLLEVASRHRYGSPRVHDTLRDEG